MARVKLGDVAREYKEVCKGSKDGLPVVGLEHITPEELTLSAWDYGKDNTFTKMFRKGHILFGRRRAYLKKAAIAPFDGICSGDITVIEALPDRILPDLLPFIIQNDRLFDYAVGKSAGSLSPRVKWEHLKNYALELPALDEQRKLADILMAANAAKDAYKRLLAATDNLVKSQFIEMFGDPVTNPKGWDTPELGTVSTSRLGKMLDAKQQTGENRFPYLANFNVQWFRFDLSELNQMDFDENAQREFELRNGDLLVCEGGEIGRCAIWRNQVVPCFYQKALHRIRCNPSVLIPEYLALWFYVFSLSHGFDDIVGNKTTIAHLPGIKLKQLRVMVPPLDLQNRFAAFVESTDKSKFATEGSEQKVKSASTAGSITV